MAARLSNEYMPAVLIWYRRLMLVMRSQVIYNADKAEARIWSVLRLIYVLPKSGIIYSRYAKPM